MGLMRVSANTGFFINTLTGKALKDDDENCVADAGEPGIYHAKVVATNGLENFIAFTNGLEELIFTPFGRLYHRGYTQRTFFFNAPQPQTPCHSL